MSSTSTYRLMNGCPRFPSMIMSAINTGLSTLTPGAMSTFSRCPIFFAESTPDGAPIDYHAAVTGALALAPSGDARQARAEDYRHMVEDGLLLDDAEPFEALLQRCQTLADKVNVAVRAGKS